MNLLTCAAAVQAVSDELAGMATIRERASLEEHLSGCDSCTRYGDQLRGTVAILGSRLDGSVPDSVRALVREMEDTRGAALSAQLPLLYAVACAIDPASADDLVQDAVTSALEAPEVDSSGSSLARALERLAEVGGPIIDSPAASDVGSDPDADAAELFYADFYADGPDAGAWIDPPVAWGEVPVLRPEDDFATAEVYREVASALAKLDPLDASLISAVDIEGTTFIEAVADLGLPAAAARERLARARFAVRSELDTYLRS